MSTLAAPAIATYRDFRLLWIGETASKLGSSVTSVALPLVAVAVLQATTLQIGLLAAASWLPWLLIGLPAGAWVDRLPRRPVMLACNAVSMAMMGSVPVAEFGGRRLSGGSGRRTPSSFRKGGSTGGSTTLLACLSIDCC